MIINFLFVHIVIVILMGAGVNGGMDVALCVGWVPWQTFMTSATTAAGWAWTKSGAVAVGGAPAVGGAVAVGGAPISTCMG